MRRPPASRPTRERTEEHTGAEPRAPRPRLADDEARAGAELLKALADPTRLHILDVLSQRQGEVCVCDLEGVVGLPDPHTGQRPRQSTISHHLRVLREAGLVGYERRGQWAYYFVQQNRLALARNLLLGLRPRES
jgi:ArsR family transcriptional regulator